MFPETFPFLSVLCVLAGAAGTGLPVSRPAARGIAVVATALGTAFAGLALLGQVPGAAAGALNPELPWLSSRVVAFAALGSGTTALALSPARGTSRGDLAVLCVLIATAAAVPSAGSGAALFALPLAGLAVLTIALGRRPGGAEALVLTALFAGVTGLLGLASAGSGAGAVVAAPLWILVLAAAPPVHGWYVRLAGVLPLNLFAGVVILQASVLESAVPAVPQAAHGPLSWVFAASGLLAALLAVAQYDARRAIAYVLASQLAVAGFAEFGAGTVSAVGGTFVLLTVVTATTGCLLLLGAFEVRRGTLPGLRRPGGCYDSWPRLASAFLVLGLVSAGLPLTLGYVGTDLVLEGAFGDSRVGTAAVVVTGALDAITVLRMYLYLFQGSAGRPQPSDLRGRELAVAFSLIACSFGFALVLLPS